MQVGFTFPRNRTWLMTNNWIGCKDVLSPIVKSIKVYLPLRNYNSTQHTVTETTMATALGSFVHYKKDVRYLLPKNKGVFNAKYEENFGRGNCDSEQVQVSCTTRKYVSFTSVCYFYIYPPGRKSTKQPGVKLTCFDVVVNFCEVESAQHHRTSISSNRFHHDFKIQIASL